jgi:hypothetical protein
MMIEGSGSIPLTSGSGSGRPKNMWIRIRNTDKNSSGEHSAMLDFNLNYQERTDLRRGFETKTTENVSSKT